MAIKTDEDLRAEIIAAQEAYDADNADFLRVQDDYYSAGSPDTGALRKARDDAKAAVLVRYNALNALKNELLARFMGV